MKTGSCYLFLLVPNNGGSTLLREIIKTDESVIHFCNDADNEIGFEYKPDEHSSKYKCARTFFVMSNILEDESYYNWKGIKKEYKKAWKLCEKEKDRINMSNTYMDRNVSNLTRANMIEKHFGKNKSYFISMIRNPYAMYEGIKRRTLNGIINSAIWAPLENEFDPDNHPIEQWIYTARKLMENIKSLNNIIWFKYEELVINPKVICDKIVSFVPTLSSLDYNKCFFTQDINGNYVNKILSNRNEEQIKKLSAYELILISNRLLEEKELMDFFGYEIL